MAPQFKRSSWLKRCFITVVGSLGKEAKISDVEKWTVNNGGTYKSKINGATTHVICTWETYKHNDFALPKAHADRKKLEFVKWSWLEDSLHDKRVKSAKKYLHPPEWHSQVDKKAVRRQALLTGKSMKEVESAQIKESDGGNLSVANEDADTRSKSRHRGAPKQVAEEERIPLAFNDFVDNSGVAWKVTLKGSELANHEDGDYIVSILVSNGEEKYYKAQYEYIEGDDEPLTRLIAVGSTLESVRIEFETFYKNKARNKWSEHYADLKNAVQSTAAKTEDDKPSIREEGENGADMQTLHGREDQKESTTNGDSDACEEKMELQ